MNAPMPERVLVSSRRKWLVVGVTGLFFVVSALANIRSATTWTWISFIAFGLAVATSVAAILRPRRLELTATTLTLVQWGSRLTLAWSECGPFHATRWPGSGFAVTFDYSPDNPADAGGRLALWTTRGRAGIPDSFGMRRDALAELLNEYRDAELRSR